MRECVTTADRAQLVTDDAANKDNDNTRIARYHEILGLAFEFDGLGSEIAKELRDMFPQGSTTRTCLEGKLGREQSRAEVRQLVLLNGSPWSPNHEDVAIARKEAAAAQKR